MLHLLSQNLKILSLSLILFLFFPDSQSRSLESEKGIAVIKGKYDAIEDILRIYEIPFKRLELKDMERNESLNNIRSIFFPCEINPPPEINVNILSMGTSIKGVTLNKNFSEIDEEKIQKNIKSFISAGGSAYFSCYSWKLLENIYNIFEFYNDFPNLGQTGKIEINLRNDLKYFCKKPDLKIIFQHPGWIVSKSIKNSIVLADGTFDTIKGIKSGPIISLIKKDKGEVLYTSYHKSRSKDDILRFFVYRISYKYLLDRSINLSDQYEQNINCSIIDSIREWETHRSYIIPVKIGENTIYLNSDKGFFEITIYDKDLNLLVSENSRRSYFNIDLHSAVDDHYILKIYQTNPALNQPYSIIAASGYRLFPYYKKYFYALIFVLSIFIFLWIKKFIGIKKFTGRLQQKNSLNEL